MPKRISKTSLLLLTIDQLEIGSKHCWQGWQSVHNELLNEKKQKKGKDLLKELIT
jgi:hypothetical protein